MRRGARRTRACAATVRCASTRCWRLPIASAPTRWPRVTTRGSSDDEQGPLLARAADPRKDQTYMLSALRPEALARVRFPLGGLTKPQVREIAAAAGLPVAQKRDSQDLCFLAGTSRERFLARHGGGRERSGEVVDAQRARARAPPGPPSLHRRAAPGSWGRRRGAAVRALHRRGREPGCGRSPGGASRAHRRPAGRVLEPRRAARGQREAALPLRAPAVPRHRRRRRSHGRSTSCSRRTRWAWRRARPPA